MLTTPSIPDARETERAQWSLEGMTITTTTIAWYVRGPLQPDCASPKMHVSKASAKRACERLNTQTPGHEIVRRSLRVEIPAL